MYLYCSRIFLNKFTVITDIFYNKYCTVYNRILKYEILIKCSSDVNDFWIPLIKCFSSDDSPQSVNHGNIHHTAQVNASAFKFGKTAK